MADAVWPGSLPQEAITAGLQETPPALTVRSEMDVGPSKVRRRVTANVRTFSITLKLTRAQLATFDEFFVTTCAGGALPFTWKHPRTANTIDFRFVGQPNYSPNAPRLSGEVDVWDVASITLEALPGTEVTSDVDPPPGDEGGHVFAIPPFSSPIEEIAADLSAGQPETDWIIFDAAPPGMEELFVMSQTDFAGGFEEEPLLMQPSSGTDQVDPDYDGNPTYEPETGDSSGGFGGVVGGGIS